MNRLILAGCFAATFCLGPSLDAREGKDTRTVTITGCVLAGTRPNTFVLTNVTEVAVREDGSHPVGDGSHPVGDESPTAGAPLTRPPAAIYWLSTIRGLKEHVGHKIEITGTVAMRDSGSGKIEVEASPAGDPIIRIKGNGTQVTAKASPQVENPLSPDRPTISRSDIERPLRQLKVGLIRMVSASCP